MSSFVYVKKCIHFLEIPLKVYTYRFALQEPGEFKKAASGHLQGGSGQLQAVRPWPPEEVLS